MPFFNRNWARACGGRWAGPRPLAGGTGGCRIVWVVEDRCTVDRWALIKAPLCKTRKKGGRRGLGPWPLRYLSQFLSERKERLLRLLSISVQILRTFHRCGGHVFIMYIVPNLRIARILSYWMRYFLPLSNEILKEKRLSRIIPLSYLMRSDL